jgi:hypothetical protein
MASPHVAGVAALYLGENRAASPADVANALLANSTPDAVTGPGTGSPNRLAYMGFIGNAGPDTTPPTAVLTAPTDGSVISGLVNLTASASDDVGVTQVEFFVDGVSVGVDASSPYALSWDSSTAADGTHGLSAKATDAAGHVGSSAAVTVSKKAPQGGEAAFDQALGAPACRTVFGRCDAMALVNGRAALGPEANRSNTLGGTCADGARGAYHVDESVDGLRVMTIDGGNFATGKRVRVEAKLWVYSTFTDDRLDLYSAPDASAPAWTHLATLAPTASGAQTLSAEFTLPAGGALQAVRAAFRYKGTSAPCATGDYNDRDDLAFAVEP